MEEERNNQQAVAFQNEYLWKQPFELLKKEKDLRQQDRQNGNYNFHGEVPPFCEPGCTPEDPCGLLTGHEKKP